MWPREKGVNIMSTIRHYLRYMVTGKGNILINGRKNTEFLINDISASGMNITSNVQVQDHEIISMHVQISGNLFNYQKDVKGKVVRKHQHNSCFHYGIKFFELSQKDIIDLDEFLRINHNSSSLQDSSSLQTGHDDAPTKQLKRA